MHNPATDTETSGPWHDARLAHENATNALRGLVERFVTDNPRLFPMTRSCGWCGSTFGVVEVRAACPSTTHGICDACLATVIAQLEHPSAVSSNEDGLDWTPSMKAR